MIDVAFHHEVPGFVLDVAFRNERGVTALFGRSGSGKSTTIGLIAGLARPMRGRLDVGAVTLVDTERRTYVPVHKRRIGLVFQESHLFPHLTVRQNLAFGRWFAPKADRVIEFDAVIETLGIGALVARRPGTLSGGERQRVALGRALLACPRLLLLDEPLAALDRARKLDILPLIERVRDEFAVPIVYVSHAIEEVVRLAAHVVELDGGRVVAAGDPASVFGPRRTVDEPRFGRSSVLTATVGAEDARYGLTELIHPAGTLWLAGTSARHGDRVRIVVRATDISLAAQAPGPLSIRSALAGTICGVETDGPFAAAEILLTGGGTIVALVTRRAMDDLGLVEGSAVRALIKTVALDEGAVG